LVELAAGAAVCRDHHSASVLVLPLDVAFWVSLAAAAAVALTAVVNAWGHYHGPLLVAPAIALLFLMNIFPLMWSSRSSFSLSGS
jgi:multiple sugar transport system permease protein